MGIVAATPTNAELLGLDTEIGTLAPGKQADLIAVDGDLRALDPRQRGCWCCSTTGSPSRPLTSAEIAAELGLSRRTVSDVYRRWVAGGFLDYHDPSRKGRSYRLGSAYENLVTRPE